MSKTSKKNRKQRRSYRIFIKRGLGSTIDLIDGLKSNDPESDIDIEPWIQVVQQGHSFRVVNDNLRDKYGDNNYDATDLGFSAWDHLCENLDRSSDAMQCFDISLHLKYGEVDLQPDSFHAPSIEKLEEALNHVTICAWCPGDI